MAITSSSEEELGTTEDWRNSLVCEVVLKGISEVSLFSTEYLMMDLKVLEEPCAPCYPNFFIMIEASTSYRGKN